MENVIYCESPSPAQSIFRVTDWKPRARKAVSSIESVADPRRRKLKLLNPQKLKALNFVSESEGRK